MTQKPKSKPEPKLIAEPFEAVIRDGMFCLQAPVVRISGFDKVEPQFIRMSNGRRVIPISHEPMSAYRQWFVKPMIEKIAQNWGAEAVVTPVEDGVFK